MRFELRPSRMGVAPAVLSVVGTLFAIVFLQSPRGETSSDEAATGYVAPHDGVSALRRIRPVLTQVQSDLGSGALPLADAFSIVQSIIVETTLERSLAYFSGPTDEERVADMLMVWACIDAAKNGRPSAVIDRLRNEYRSLFGREWHSDATSEFYIRESAAHRRN